MLPYVLPDPVLQRKLEAVGCAAVMPLAAPIGSGRGLKLRHAIEIMVEQAEVPVIVDAGLGAPSQAAECMELGADARAREHCDRAGGRSRRDGARVPARPSRRAAPAHLAGLIEERETARAVEPDHRPRRLVNVTVNGREQLEPRRARRSSRCSTSSASTAPYALVERNGEPVERERYGETALEDGDALVVARPVAGG